MNTKSPPYAPPHQHQGGAGHGHAGNANQPLMPGGQTTWSHSLCSCGTGVGACLFGWLFPMCAYGSAMSEQTGANCLFLTCCATPPLAHNQIRENYNIEGDCVSDIVVSVCCLPCSATRAYSEAQLRGPLPSAMRR
mmetsp:Transcript_12121/g.38469  ORF Transcript_12121/g.38469 Transcript_12121/m.38469 type:complete len:136 (-) Transcript_12121:1-408(-)